MNKRRVLTERLNYLSAAFYQASEIKNQFEYDLTIKKCMDRVIEKIIKLIDKCTLEIDRCKL